MADPVTLAIVGATVSAAGGIGSGLGANSAAQFNAEEQRIAAGQEAAIGQRAAQERRDEAEALMSTAQARAAGAGGDTTSGSPLLILSEIAAEGELNALRDQATGRQREQDLRQQSRVTSAEGRSARNASIVGAAGSLLTGLSNARLMRTG